LCLGSQIPGVVLASLSAYLSSQDNRTYSGVPLKASEDFFRKTGGNRALAVNNSRSFDRAGMDYHLTTGRAQSKTNIVGVVGIEGGILIRKIIGV
jgi:hypothetical protein